ncbi:thermonuclease family protein [Sphingopyxis sp. JAI128]|uniref:thermonuclease family protein n=1 Tax=Sphingopyxis sp. JAI128 TaxID=2723066 RepID=UPI00161E7449|nr:thermonuclease family protein [Sphingopyxis sp. JAI128]MBB6427965.1 endonuclease YncB(thermonuclease family) [Sphingopyxis sp. JAI128]
MRSLAALLVLAVFALAAWSWFPAPVATLPLVHIIDGDSLTVRHDGATLTIRLTDIDAAEYLQDCGRADATRWPCGREARAMLVKIAGDGPLTCEIAAKDRYDRTLAACRTRPLPGGIDIGAEMVRLGGAVATGDAYRIEEAEARAKRRGIWQGDFVRPADWRAAHERPATALTWPDA